jgi:hypothetical protein
MYSSPPRPLDRALNGRVSGKTVKGVGRIKRQRYADWSPLSPLRSDPNRRKIIKESIQGVSKLSFVF